jgi:hypothetical protein
MKKRLIYWMAFAILVFIACQKEESFELGNSPAEGSLQSDISGDCLPKTVSGTYEEGTPLVPTNSTITVSVNVTKTGIYSITTDTVNGIYFKGTGTFTTLGPTNVTLQGNGTPFAVGVNNYVVTFGASICDIQVTTLPSGAGPAVLTLNGAPGNCATPTINGNYILNTALNATNTVVLNVTVTTAGSYNITTTAVNGMTFAGTGTLAVGNQTITLNGTGTPTTAGANSIPITVGGSTCSFSIDVTSGATGSLDGGPGACAPITINGTYTGGVALTGSNNVVIQVDFSTAGPYSISTSTAGGMTFAKSGTATVGNDQSITLDGTGTPIAGTHNFTVTFGTSTCTFSVLVVPGGGPAVGTLDGGPGACSASTVNGTYRMNTALTAANTVQVRVDVTTAGTYTISTNTVAGFSFSKSGTLAVGNDQMITLDGTGTPTASGTQTFTVTFGTSTCTFTVDVLPAMSNDYFPRTPGSNWSYEFDNNSIDSLYRTATASTHNAVGNTFTIFMANDGFGLDSSGYYRKTSSPNNYYEWFDYGSFFGYDNPAWGEYIILKDDVAQGTNWKTPSSSPFFDGTVNGGQPFSARFSSTLVQKDATVSITTSLGTQQYQNVDVVNERVEVFDGANWIDVTAQIGVQFKTYYARGIGIIKVEELDAAGTTVTWLQELRRYQVN